jgi:hypothetical protein
MANSNNPNGFTPVRHLAGGIVRMKEYKIATDTAAAIFSGDMVELLTTGYVSVGTAASANFLGAFAGCQYTAESGEIVFSKYWPAAQATLGNADAVAFIYDDPNIVYAVQDSATAAFADNGGLFDLTATAGSTSNGRSNQEMDSAASADDFFRQLGLHEVEGNAWGADGVVEVIIHKHAYTDYAGVDIA